MLLVRKQNQKYLREGENYEGGAISVWKEKNSLRRKQKPARPKREAQSFTTKKTRLGDAAWEEKGTTLCPEKIVLLGAKKVWSGGKKGNRHEEEKGFVAAIRKERASLSQREKALKRGHLRTEGGKSR